MDYFLVNVVFCKIGLAKQEVVEGCVCNRVRDTQGTWFVLFGLLHVALVLNIIVSCKVSSESGIYEILPRTVEMHSMDCTASSRLDWLCKLADR